MRGDFDGAARAESAGSFRDDTHLAVEALDGTRRELTSSAEPVEDELAVAAPAIRLAQPARNQA
jgi:hypothetical protein